MVLQHVGLIPDGNRRWARANNVSLTRGYRAGMARLAQLTDHLMQCDVRSVSLYLLSADNLKRDSGDLAAVVAAESYFVDELMPPIIARHKATIALAGRMSALPQIFRPPLRRLLANRPAAACRRVYLCAGYDPFDEIAFSPRANISSLWVPERLDLIIRSGGHARLSNFLPLQSAYAELYFLEKMFPDVTTDDVDQILERFSRVTKNSGR